ncbi:MAG TPA: hypothetical protein VMR25_12125 [Planctomycetaceae bacterium]|jgi:hypothetical protein|nr:hypothetical protein [Planctomycetaceae bacterium]
MQNRRFARLTNAFSKKWENHELMFALVVAWYNFSRPRMTLKTTPAAAVRLTGTLMSDEPNGKRWRRRTAAWGAIPLVLIYLYSAGPAFRFFGPASVQSPV